jgi:hypothetical protein
VWLKGGRVTEDGPAGTVVENYFEAISTVSEFSAQNQQYGFTVKRVVLRNSKGNRSTQFLPGDDMTVELEYRADQPLEQPYITLGIIGKMGSCFTANMLLDGNRPAVLHGEGKLSCRFKAMPIFPQSYSVKMAIRTKNGIDMVLDYTAVAYFNVTGDLANYGFKGEFLSRIPNSTSVVVPYEWHLPDGTVTAVSLTSDALRQSSSATEAVSLR